MDALETAGAHPKVNGKGMRAKASKQVSEIGRASVEERGSVSLGNDLRLESERFMGAALEFEDQIIQFSVFGAGNGNGSSPRGRMRRESAKRGNRNRLTTVVVRVPVSAFAQTIDIRDRNGSLIGTKKFLLTSYKG